MVKSKTQSERAAMYALEFETKNRGRFIELPFEVSENQSLNLRVVVMSDVPLEQYASRYKSKSDYLKILKNRKLEISKEIDVDRLIDEMNK